MNKTDNLKICYVLKRYPRFSETFIVNEILALEAQGMEIHIVAIKPPTEGVFHENLSKVKAPVTYLPALSQSPTKFFHNLTKATSCYGLVAVGELFDQDIADLEHGLRVAKIVRDIGAQVIHAHFATSAAAIARIASRLTDIPYTVTAHAKDIFHEDVVQTALQARLCDAARVVTVSEFNLRHLTSLFPEATQNIKRIYNGLPLDVLPVRVDRAPANRVVGVGRLIEKKGMRFLLQAIAKLAQKFPQVRCDIVGDGPLRQSLMEQAALLGISEHVRFRGILPQHQVHQLMVQADVFVAPCIVAEDGDRDGLPTVLLEAMAIGTPCVATPVTGIPEIITHRKTGMLVPEGDAAAIFEACTMLFEDADLALTIAGSAAHLIAQQFDSARNTEQLISEWRSIVKYSRKEVA